MELERSTKQLTLVEVEHLATKIVDFMTTIRVNSTLISEHLVSASAGAQQIKVAAASPPKITVAVLGESGAGKSTLLNSLLDVAWLPNSGTDVCTAGITRVRSADINNFRVTVSFANRSDWLDEIGKISNDIKGALSDMGEAGELPTETRILNQVVSRLDRERVSAVYGREQAARFFETGEHEHLLEPEKIAVALDTDEVVTEFDVSATTELTIHLRGLLTDKDSSENGGQLWPIVQDVLVEGRFDGLPPQLELVDLPGVNDPNSAREQKTLDYLENARFLIVAYDSVRPPTEQVGRVLRSRQLAKKLILSGRDDSITFVATKSDGFDDSDRMFDDYEDLSLEAKAKLFVIKVRKTLNNSLLNIAEDVASESESVEEEKRLHSSLVGSKKFVTSSRSYTRLKEIEAGKKRTPPPFQSLKDTEIPALRAHLAYLAAVAGPQTLARRYRLELLDIVSTVLTAAKQELALMVLNTADNRRLLSMIVDQVSELSQQLIGDLESVPANELGYLQEATSSLFASAKIDVGDALKFSRRYRQVVQSLHWSTLRAACSRGGRYSSPSAGLVDLQNLVTQPIVETLFDALAKFFDEALAGAVSSAKREIENYLLHYAERVNELVVHLTDSEVQRVLNDLTASARALADQSLAATVIRIQAQLQKGQETLLGVARNAVAKNMSPEIYEAGAIRGNGSANRMREVLAESAGLSFASSYQETLVQAEIIVGDNSTKLTEALHAVVSETVEQIRRIQTLIAPQEAEEDTAQLSELNQIIGQIEAFSLSIRVEESESLIDLPSTPFEEEESEENVKIEGSFILVDGSNLATFRTPSNGARVTSLKALLRAKEALSTAFPERKIKVFVDASFRHLVAEDEKSEVDSLLSSGEMIQPGPRTPGKADRVILSFAQQCDSLIVSNDAFKQWEDEFPLVNTASRFLNAVFDVDLGWQFFSRA